jgi:DNA-binding transcriptional regulator YhcF (GntR family)
MNESDNAGPNVLGIVIDRDADIPIGVQLAWALRARVHDGRLSPGQRLPGLRDLAEGLGINVNTVRAVFQRLEQERIVDSQQGSGTFVAETPAKPSSVGAIAADAARAAHDTGVDPREVAAALYVAPALPEPRPDAAEAGRRRHLRAQIGSLEQTLSELETKHPGIVPAAPERVRAGHGPRLLDVSELEAVLSQLLRRLATLQNAIDAVEQAAEDATPEKVKAPKRAARKRPATRPASAGT